MFTDTLIKALHAKKYLYKKDYNLIPEHRGIVNHIRFILVNY